MKMSDCLFCKIAAGEIPATVVVEDESFVGFRDIDPQAPTHVLAIPRLHVGSLNETDHLIIIDAAQLDSPPGTVRLYEGEAMDRFLKDRRNNSVHQVSLLDLLAIAQLSGSLPGKRALIGIQPECIDWSDTLSDAAEKAIPIASVLVDELITKWRQ